MLDSAVKHGIVDKRGAWYNMGEEKIGQGKENAVRFIEENPEIAAEIESKIRALVFPGQVLKDKDGKPVEAGAGKKASKAKAEKAAEAPVDAGSAGAAGQEGLF